MNLKPTDLFFGLIEFLAFIIPGFILCATLPYYLDYYLYWGIPHWLDITDENASAFVWIAFVMVSYIAGHFLHGICAFLFNPLYERTQKKYKLRKYKGFIDQAIQTVEDKLPLHSNHLKAAEAYLRVHQPSVIADVEKHEANSKLFRSLTFLSLYLCCYPRIEWITGLPLIAIAALSFMRFANQRWTYHFLVYEYFCIVSKKD